MIILYTKQSLDRREPIQISVPALLVHAPHGNRSNMLSGMVIPGDMVEEEEEESTEGVSSDGYRTPSPGVISTPAVIPPPSGGKSRKRRKPESRSTKGMD